MPIFYHRSSDTGCECNGYLKLDLDYLKQVKYEVINLEMRLMIWVHKTHS